MMKTLLKVNKLELVRNYQNIVLLKAGKVISKFALDQLLPAIVGLLSLASKKEKKLSGSKIMSTFQPDLF